MFYMLFIFNKMLQDDFISIFFLGTLKHFLINIKKNFFWKENNKLIVINHFLSLMAKNNYFWGRWVQEDVRVCRIGLIARFS